MTAPGTLAPLHLQWRYSALDLRPLPSAVPSARLHTRLVLLERGHGGVAENAELIVAELVANAVAASQRLPQETGQPFVIGPPPVQLRLTGGVRIVKIEVWDASNRMPRLRHETPDDLESGRGLILVDALSDRWGATPTRGGGKTVWAVMTPATFTSAAVTP
jgi:anti-sigma regulatory factor (Ser/Thr protein kinase)